jgi:hypothetical protein
MVKRKLEGATGLQKPVQQGFIHMSGEMENQLTEFISLACYSAERLHGISGVPHSVIEKMLSIANKVLNIHIENLETIIYRHASQNVLTFSGLIIQNPPIPLVKVQSRLFRIAKGSGKKKQFNFEYTKRFLNIFPNLMSKSYMFEYENAISEILSIWRCDGELDNLLYIDMLRTNDGGLSFLIADLERVVIDIDEYVNSNFYLEKGESFKRRDDRIKNTNHKINSTLGSLHKKIMILRDCEKVEDRLTKGKISIMRKYLLENARPFPADTYMFILVESIAACLSRTWELVKTLPIIKIDEEDLFISFETGCDKLIEQLKNILNILLENTCNSEPLEEKEFENVNDEIVYVVRSILHEISKWNRAFLGCYDSQYFSQHERKNINKVRHSILFYDIKGSTKHLEALDKQFSISFMSDYDLWFNKITAIPKNWGILFGAGISSRNECAGDKLSCYFCHSNAPIYSAGVALHHLKMLNKVCKKLFTYQLRAGVGEGSVYFSGEQEHTLVINYIAHNIEKLCDIEIPSDFIGSCVLVLEDFIDEHPQWKEYCTDCVIPVGEKKAILIDVSEIPGQIADRIMKSVSD